MTASALSSARRLATVGDCCIDVYAAEGFWSVGGNALNVAAQWSFMGHDAAYVGAVGRDEHAAEVRLGLQAAGVDATAVRTIEGRTGVTRIELRADGERVLAHEDFGVSADFAPDAEDLDRLSRVQWVHGATLGGFRQVAARLRQHGVPFSFDFSTRHESHDLGDVEVGFYSHDGLPDEEARALALAGIDGGLSCAVVTCGAHGSLAATTEETQTVPADVVPVVDTCGAGDSFVARFVTARLDGMTLEGCLRAAAANAAVTCGHLGGWHQDLRRLKEASR